MSFWDDIGIGPGSDDTGNLGSGEGTLYADKNGTPAWGGLYGYQDAQGHIDTSVGGAETDVRRYRGMGEASWQRGAPQLNYDYSRPDFDRGSAYNDRFNAGQSRESQLAAAAMQRRAAEMQYGAAMGTAPSRAELLGQHMTDQGLQAQLAGAASASGGSMAQAAAQRQVYQGAAAYQQQATQQLAALRADEMAHARDAYANNAGAYMQGVSGIRGQDYGAAQQAAGMADASARWAQAQAQAQGQMELGQEQLNQQNQQFYEGKGFDTRTAELNQGLQSQAMYTGNKQFDAGMALKRDEQAYNLAGAGVGAGATVGSAMITSDARAKTSIAEAAFAKGHAAGRASQPRVINAAPVVYDDTPQPYLMGGRENPYQTLAGGDQDPYIVSDARAKREAFQSGVLYADGDPAAQKLPDYMAPASQPTRQMKSYQRQDAALAGASIRDAEKADALRERAKAMTERSLANSLVNPAQGVVGPVLATMVAPAIESQDARAEREWNTSLAPKQIMSQSAPVASIRPPQLASVSLKDNGRGPEGAMVSDERAKMRPDGSPVADANRSMAGAAYAYKGAFTPPEQQQGEPNYGPMAQNMERSPVAATAVKTDPATGLKVIDRDKALKVTMAGVADLQRQNDELRASIQEREGGGPVEPGQPYLVGERGPELVVPSQDGVVVPTHSLAQAAMGMPPPRVYYAPSGQPMAQRETEVIALAPKPREMKSFRRDTSAEQKRVADAYAAKLAAQADAMMAGYHTQLSQGPTVAVVESPRPMGMAQASMMRAKP